MWLASATRRPVRYTGLHPRSNHHAALLHTNGGPSSNGSLYGWWSQIAGAGQHIGAHIQVMKDGRAEQYVDTDLVVYHAFSASEFAVGIETEDDGHPSTPWTTAQCDRIVAILHELQVPAVMIPTASPADGVGYHQQFTSWNQNSHQCPDSVRVAQIRRAILPQLAASYSTPQPTPRPGGYAMPPTIHQTSSVSRPSPWVRKMQGLLIADGAEIIVDGLWGPATSRALRNFKSAHRLGGGGGVCGDDAWRALIEK